MSDAAIAITGIGAVTALGASYRQIADNLLAGRSGVREVPEFDHFPIQPIENICQRSGLVEEHFFDRTQLVKVTNRRTQPIARRIGRNELAVIRICHTYVAAQHLYSRRSHDGRRSGLFATKFRSAPRRHDGLYWPADHLEKRSPLGDLVAEAEKEGRAPRPGGPAPSPFHGYYFRILTAQGPHALDGERDFIANGEMSGGFALVAWPAQYDVTGVMTFIVNQAGIVHESDLGPDTDTVARAMVRYDPDGSWKPVQ